MLNSVIAVGSYAYFFWSLPLALTAFMVNVDIGSLVPGLAPYFPYYSIDANPHIPGYDPLLVDVALLGLFAIPHSVFARSKL